MPDDDDSASNRGAPGLGQSDFDFMQYADGPMGVFSGIWENEAMQNWAEWQVSAEVEGTASPSASGELQETQETQEGAAADSSNDGTQDELALSDISTLCPGEGRISRQQTAPANAFSLPSRSRHEAALNQRSGIVLRVKGTFMESVMVDEELDRMPVRRSWSDGDLAQLQDMDGQMEQQL